jgi:hypothetical protein
MTTFEFLCEDVTGEIVSVEVEELTYWEAKKVFKEENPTLSRAVVEVIDGKTGANLEFDY